MSAVCRKSHFGSNQSRPSLRFNVSQKNPCSASTRHQHCCLVNNGGHVLRPANNIRRQDQNRRLQPSSPCRVSQMPYRHDLSQPTLPRLQLAALGSQGPAHSSQASKPPTHRPNRKTKRQRQRRVQGPEVQRGSPLLHSRDRYGARQTAVGSICSMS